MVFSRFILFAVVDDVIVKVSLIVRGSVIIPVVGLIVGVFCPGLLGPVGIFFIECGVAAALPAVELSITFSIPAACFVVLTEQQVQGFDDRIFFQRRSLQRHHLALLL